ncbi:hypothetical protein AC578_5375 [Pseudocercospora eumusae]|uniref:Mitochondrial chaperone BCS1-like ATPase lid domain-containing protein n=1 Tax=Pseudocercospora eumusae TaxID=321146 RepID=A0A139HJX0_9PEZI|nr:hypothetical protein AC578_5375 [Pseudocercospora eumusae]
MADTSKSEYPALIRPGRCDRKILMGHASRQVAALLSKKTFTAIDGVDDLDTLFETFAANLPDDSLTPAEIQNFLMTHRDAPSMAIELAAEWSADIIALKAKCLTLHLSVAISIHLSNLE